MTLTPTEKQIRVDSGGKMERKLAKLQKGYSESRV